MEEYFRNLDQLRTSPTVNQGDRTPTAKRTLWIRLADWLDPKGKQYYSIGNGRDVREEAGNR
jgi:hypothetical protein